MNDQDSIVEYFTRMLTLTNQMKNYGDRIEDAMIVDKILRTLTPRFDHIVVAIEQGTDLEGMKVEELQGILEAQEIRLNERNSLRSSNQALQAQTYKGNSSDQDKNKKGKGNWKKGKNQSEGLNSAPKQQQNSKDNNKNVVHTTKRVDGNLI